MTFIASEKSHRGDPVELYEFRYAQATVYRYTSDDTDYQDGPVTYTAKAIRRGGIEFTGDLGRSELNVDVQNDLPVLELFKSGLPSGLVTMTIFRLHRDDGEKAVLWKGRVTDVSFNEDAYATITCAPGKSALRTFGLRRNFQYQCPHILYGVACGISRASFQTNGDVTVLSNVIASNAWTGVADNYFAGGYVEWNNPSTGTPERVSVSASNGTTGALTLFNLPVGLSNGDTVKAFAGCDKSITTCNTKFGNTVNFGGFPHTPGKSPFDGTPIF